MWLVILLHSKFFINHEQFSSCLDLCDWCLKFERKHLFNLHFRVDIRRSLLHQNIETIEEVSSSNSVVCTQYVTTIFKETVNVISSNPLFKEWHIRLTMIPILLLFSRVFLLKRLGAKMKKLSKLKNVLLEKWQFLPQFWLEKGFKEQFWTRHYGSVLWRISWNYNNRQLSIRNSIKN